MVKRTQPYEAGEQSLVPGGIKLNTNENPYPPSPEVFTALNSVLTERLRTYPDPDSARLRQAIAELHEVKEEQVFTGNGSDEVLAFSFMAFFSPDRPIRFPAVTYSFYPTYAQLFNIPYERLPLRQDFTLDETGLFQSEGGVIFPNPNAPTGIELKLASIEAVCRENEGRPVIVDEAYIDFGGDTAIPLLAVCKNLLIVRTLSKSRSLAGMRIGYAIGSEEMIQGLERIKNSFNSYPIDRLAQAAGEAAIRDNAYFRATIAAIIRTREQSRGKLETLGFDVLPSSANFLFARPTGIAASDLYVLLKERGILVRHFRQPETREWLRITIGTEEEMGRFFQELEILLLRNRTAGPLSK